MPVLFQGTQETRDHSMLERFEDTFKLSEMNISGDTYIIECCEEFGEVASPILIPLIGLGYFAVARRHKESEFVLRRSAHGFSVEIND